MTSGIFPVSFTGFVIWGVSCGWNHSVTAFQVDFFHSVVCIHMSSILPPGSQQHWTAFLLTRSAPASPKEEYLLDSKFGQLWIKLPSIFMCSFLCRHTFSTDLGRGQEVHGGWIIQECVSFCQYLPCHLAGGQTTLCFLLWCRSTPVVPLLPNFTSVWSCLCVRPF